MPLTETLNTPDPAFATVSSKGQITLPIAMRKALGLHAGSKISIEAKGLQLLIKPDLPISAYRGFLKGYNISAADIEIPKEKDKY